ncbi:hypothetical protein EYR38_006228 [Pleurotus pulmonarius]|nr:hypothetical protein EYR38_006228 [Pleurotus pulmonarius]
MSSDYEFSDDEGDYYDDEDMMDTQEDEDDDEMMGSYDDFKIAPKGKHKSYEVEYESLSQDAVEKLMSADVEHICGIFGVDRDTALLLLRSMSWNKERLIEKYMDNATSVLCAAGIQVPEPTPENSRSHSTTARRATRSTSKFLGLSTTSKSKSPASPIATSPKPFVCPICFDDSPDLNTRALVCEHQFCTGCWSTYICSKIRDEGEHAIRCMAEGCHIIAPDTFIRTVLSSEDGDPEENALALARFHELLVLEKGGGLGIQAKEHKFCFGCPIDGDHRPLICTVARMWIKKCRDDSETANWIKSNTKECTNCLSTIEKNGGCNHMTCKKCKHEFCWVCMGPWSEHGTQWYSCNRYDEKAGIDARDAQSRSRASLERYLHYYNRWANHEQSAKLSIDLYAKTEKKMEDMQVTSALTWIEVQFMKKAVEEVDKCRMTLKWTYAMAYYLAKGNEKDLFEDNQRDLEKAVEDLSELLESPIEPETIPQLRQKVTDKTVYVQNRNEIVLEDTANGFLEGRWKWNAVVEGFDEPERLEY